MSYFEIWTIVQFHTYCLFMVGKFGIQMVKYMYVFMPHLELVAWQIIIRLNINGIDKLL